MLLRKDRDFHVENDSNHPHFTALYNEDEGIITLSHFFPVTFFTSVYCYFELR